MELLSASPLLLVGHSSGSFLTQRTAGGLAGLFGIWLAWTPSSPVCNWEGRKQ